MDEEILDKDKSVCAPVSSPIEDLFAAESSVQNMSAHRYCFFGLNAFGGLGLPLLEALGGLVSEARIFS